MQSEEVVGAALAGRPTSEDGANHSAYLANPKAEYSYFGYADGQEFTAAWLVRHGVRANLAGVIAELSGLGGRSA